MGWPAVQGYQDGVDRVDAQTLNRPLSQLAERTEYLKRLVEASDRQKVVASGIEFSPASGTGAPAPGQPVYRNPENGTYALAAAAVGENKWFYADSQAMAVGVVGADGSTVVLYGYVGFKDGIDAGTVIVDKNPASGRYFLSATPGKLTATPTGPVIYVCDCQIKDGKVTSMLVSPQYRDTGESHVHRAFVISGKPLGTAVKAVGRYRVTGITPRGVPVPTDMYPGLVAFVPYGHWAYDGDVKYILRAHLRDGAQSGSQDWADYELRWTSSDGESGTVLFGETAPGLSWRATIGSHGLRVGMYWVSDRTPDSCLVAPNGTYYRWDIAMPDAARAWLEYPKPGNTATGFRLNLGMYPELLAYVPDNGVAMPVNGAALTVGGVDRAGPVFGVERRGWSIEKADGDGGPWLMWYGGEVPVEGDVTATAPFIWESEPDSDPDKRPERDLVLYLNRMRVGPTGFVTSLQAAPGSPIRVTSAQTGATAMQGALMINLDVDFKSAEGNAEGSQVVKSIVGNTFVTGQVVERIVAGPGIAVDRQQGTVTVSVSNAVYAGDFETIALRNAKQDLAGGVFPYTKLLEWRTGASNVQSGFTAKFRVPDFIPYNKGKGYYVVVSASVFGESASAGGSAAAFRLGGYLLADQACSAEADATGFNGSIASPGGGYEQVVHVPFADGYRAFDPVLAHGFASADGQGPGVLVLPDTAQRVRDDALWLRSAADARMVVYPGYFVGVSIERCGVSGTGTAYEPAIGFLSLRWNLVAVQ